MIFKMIKTHNQIKIVVYLEDMLICEYICIYQKRLNQFGADLLKTTLLSWATLDFSVADKISIDIPLNLFEQEYIDMQYEYCTKSYVKVYDYEKAILSYTFTQDIRYREILLEESYYLGYTEGKDSTLCKELIESVGKKINYYKVSYDDDEPAEDGHVFCNIINEELYNKYTITGWKSNSDIISFQQADDIHVTFACPYVYEKQNYSKYLAVGIPWDAIHDFVGGEPDLVPTETYHSIRLFENLLNNYGLSGFRVISPIASLHTYAVYGILERILGLKKLEKLDSCWDSYAYKGKACGYCPKCQRLKKVFWDCFGLDNDSDVPKLKIESADFLFGSIYATKILSLMSAENLKNTMFDDDCSKAFSGEFYDVIKNRFKLNVVEKVEFEFSLDDQKWDEVLNHLICVISIDYNKLNDEKCNHEEVPYLPFEKYYQWRRKEKVLNCYDIIQWNDSSTNKLYVKKISNGDRCIMLPSTDLFNQYIKKTSFFD